ncbi:FMN-dependent alpha-hydroxy acid dehydrogenase [Lentinula edodes]|uniref:FMN-dependent alpha-hydroxy acid dehydrogenase n=1 Tax=Lentinula edodes TaxID=5353 RepID=A0A1Q3DZP8_LENED|nr:FMN-dependent alpha-hydroxy acid dehydrogenase [Lentinula edodes]KAH7867833.1 FMN-dependent alpha-hydroxy acid dehydrogenase [Lentinula edodes]KAJ3921813.1 FMN-dependent alpha-hydroxy acid dehydrogenase [Lentinula edodes]GAW00483.1 FMN-dependent alpha-hydroxy acid dehydrogenase [Lentinula edodes]
MCLRVHKLIVLWLGFVLLTLVPRSCLSVEIDREGLPDTGLNTTDWETGALPPLDDMWELNDFQIAAKNVLGARWYASYRTAALDQVTYEANMNIWKKIRLNGYTFRDVSDVNLNTTILGYNFTVPFFIAPAAYAGHTNASAELSLARAAGKMGALYAPSIESTKTIEEIADVGFANQTMFHQEYVWSNRTLLIDDLSRIEAAGYKAIFLTVDNTGVNGIRVQAMRQTGELDSDSGHSASFTLDALAEIQNLTTLPIVPKGIKTAADAKTCLDLGFPAIYVSNHGGRVLDGVPTAVEILLDIRKQYPEVFEQMEVYADGGVRSANHIITLLALGAKAVGLGRSPIFANIYGEDGVDRMLTLLQAELQTSLQLMGEADIQNVVGNTTYINTKQVEVEYFGIS